MTARFLVDTAVMAYTFGAAHEQREACRRVVERATAGEFELHASVEMVQELLHHRMRRTERAHALRQARAAGDLCVLHAFDAGVLARALELVADTQVRGRDAVHLATGLVHGVTRVISPDHDFDGVPGVVRVDPSDLT